jgi:predicted ester cyclase
MDASAIKAKFAAAYDAAFNRGDDALGDTCASGLTDHSIARAGGQTGLIGFKARVAGHRTGFSDLKLAISKKVAEGSYVAILWTVSGTQNGPRAGRPASGKTMQMQGMNLERLESGPIVEHHSNPDLLAAFMQLGFVPAPGQPGK